LGGHKSRVLLYQFPFWFNLFCANGTEIRYKIDTGAQANVLPSEILKGINPQVVIEPTKAKLSTYDGNNIKVLLKYYNLIIETGNQNQKSC